MSQYKHIPVMLKEVVDVVKPQQGKLIIDATFGDGGYTKAFLEKGANVIAIDRDPNAIERAKILASQYAEKFTLELTNFANLAEIEKISNQNIDAIILDIGVSSMQIDNAIRGFSFQKEGPLDMRMSQTGISAAEVINQLPENELARIFYILGEEKQAKIFAKAITEYRKIQPINTTLQLATLIEKTNKIKQYKRNIHPATKVFQALRIYVNDELGELVKVLFASEKILKNNGILVVVTFHSLEDRIVKRFFNSRSRLLQNSRYLPAVEVPDFSFEMIIKGIKTPSDDEIKNNPRSRSAKLRAAKRTSGEAYSPVEEDFLSAKMPRLKNFFIER
ncbi:16S rRNA (cytosine(1402)-N(4))-methyltransferase RsmH [Bartonella sp. DGB1]|uniref:16S rRNA (cytosine(1402)-N(4))-methyltransferase RsmH n=1 Tax=Bartonella sp. DGB1 TaxID=3239807 RepID=UPI0035246BEF